MKRIIFFLVCLICSFSAFSQLPTQTIPSRVFFGLTRQQWILLDSPIVHPTLDTFYARHAGTELLRIQGGDTALWFYAGGRRWFRQLNVRDSSSMLSPYLRKIDTTNKWLPRDWRFVDTVYRVNDSTVGYTVRGLAYTFEIKGGAGGGGGSGTNNTNTGSSFPWLNEGTQQIKTVANSNTILWDSTSTVNSLTAKADTSVLATQYDLTQIGSGDTSLFTNIHDFGAVGDGVTDNTTAINNAIIAATINGKPIVYMPAGTYIVRSAYRDTAVVYKPTGIQLQSNVTLIGAGVGKTIIKLSAPPVSSTFSAIGAPVTYSTNTSFNHIIWGTNVSNVVLMDFSVHGNLANQINYNVNPYLTPQDSTHTDSCETDGIKFWFGTNNKIINVRIDSVAGYGIANFGSLNHITDRVVVTTSVNGGVYYTRNAYGSSLSNSLITNNHADNVRIRSSYIDIGPNNEISWTKFNPNVLQANFAGVYIESDSGTNLMPDAIVGVKVFGNYIHDNSAYGADAFNRDTLLYTAEGYSVSISNNTISYNSNAGITMHMQMMQIQNNQILENAANSNGVQDPFVRECGIALTQYAVGSTITGNTFRDTRGFQDYALGGAAPDVPNVLTVTGNSAFGGVGFLQSPSSTFNVPIYGNTFYLNGVIQADFKRRAVNGNLFINPTTNGVDFFNGTGSGYAAFRYGSSFESGIVGQNSSGTNHIGFGVSDRAHWASSGAGTNAGREFWWYDFVSAVYRGGMNASGELFMGPTLSSYSFRVKQPGADITSANQMEVVGTGIGSTVNQVQAVGRFVMNPGYTGSGTSIGVYSTNTSVQTGNNSGGAGTFRGALGFYGGSTGASTAGVGMGALFFSLSSNTNVGGTFDATVSQRNDAGARSIGGQSFARKAHASAIQVGHYAGFNNTQPTYVSAALLVDNSDQTDPIFLGRDNGVVKFSIKDGGNTAINTTGGADIDPRMLYINGSIGANKDSITLQSIFTSRQMLVIDTATGRFERMSFGDTATITRSPLITYVGAGLIPDTIAIAGLNGFGTAGQLIRVNATADGFEYFTNTSGTTLYTGDGTISSSRTVTSGSNSQITFDGFPYFNIKSGSLRFQNSAATQEYNIFPGTGFPLNIGWTHAGVFDDGIAIQIDTNNNAAIGVAAPVTTSPLFATGTSLWVGNGLLSAAGNFYKVRAVTATGNILITDYFITIDATGGAVTLTLPAASAAFGNNVGIQYVIKRLDNSGNTITVQRNGTPGTDTIDGAASFTLTTQYEVREVQCISTSAFALK